MRISHVDHFSYFVLVMKENLWILRTSLKDYFSSILYFRERGILDFPKISFFFSKEEWLCMVILMTQEEDTKLRELREQFFFY